MKNRARLFDGLITLLQTILFSLLGEFFSLTVDQAGESSGGESNPAAIFLTGLWVAAFGSQIAGSWFKRLPLQRRLARQKPEPRKGVWGCLGGLLLLAHFVWSVLNAAIVLLLLPELDSEAEYGAYGVAGLLLSVVSTALVVRALWPLPASVVVTETDGAAERLADLLLFPGMILGALAFDFIATFWVQDVLLDAYRRTASLEGVLFGLLVYFYIFAMVYLPPRLLFLVEDYRSRSAWIGIALASLPPLIYFFV